MFGRRENEKKSPFRYLTLLESKITPNGFPARADLR
jgi:hypothetical protein